MMHALDVKLASGTVEAQAGRYSRAHGRSGQSVQHFSLFVGLVVE